MSNILKIFIGVDPRQPVAYNVLQASIYKHCSQPVAITPLKLDTLPIKRQGLTQFTFSRFLVPYLCDFKGTGLFLDADMLVTGDISELFMQANGMDAVQVCKNQPRFEWPSVMLFNCEKCTALTPEYVDDPKNELFDFGWGSVGEFDPNWNYCIGYVEPQEPKLYHYTSGIPIWHETRSFPAEDKLWLDEYRKLGDTVPWKDLMSKSVHAKATIERLVRRLVM